MTTPPTTSKSLSIALWATQAVLALLFVGTGLFKLATPIATLAALWPWAGAYPTLLRLTGLVDVAGGLGILLPALTRIRPGLTGLAALGLAALQLSAIVFHVARGEAANTPFNGVLLVLALFVWWGRHRAPVYPKARP